jgi:hypothetical protein
LAVRLHAHRQQSVSWREAEVLTSSSSAPVTASDALGNRANFPAKAPHRVTGFRDLRPASRRRTSSWHAALVVHWFKAVSSLRLRCRGTTTATSMVAKVGWPVLIKIELDGYE